MAKRKKKQVISMKDMEKQMSTYATDATARTRVAAGNTLGIRAGKFTFKQNVIGRTMKCVILDHVFSNAFYGDDDFDPDNPIPPTCLALSVGGKDMKPIGASPQAQNNACQGCDQNRWGSAEVGRGKKCKNQYRLAILEPGVDPEDAEIAVLTVPPTSLVNFTKYVDGLATKLKPARAPNGVITEISFEADADWPILKFEMAAKIDDPELFMAITSRMEEARNVLMEEPDFSGWKEATNKGSKKKKKTKKKTKKKVKKKASKRKSKFS